MQHKLEIFKCENGKIERMSFLLPEVPVEEYDAKKHNKRIFEYPLGLFDSKSDKMEEGIMIWTICYPNTKEEDKESLLSIPKEEAVKLKKWQEEFEKKVFEALIAIATGNNHKDIDSKTFTLSDMEHCWDEATKSLYKDTGNVPMITGNISIMDREKEKFEAYIKKNYSDQ